MARPARRAVWWVGSVDASIDGTEGVTGGREGEGEGERERGRERARGRRQEGDELGQARAEVVEVGGSISSSDQKQRRLQRKGKLANNSHSHAPRCRPHGRIGRATERNPRGTWTGDAIVGCSHSSTPRPATNRRANLSCKLRDGGADRPRRGLRCGGYLSLA